MYICERVCVCVTVGREILACDGEMVRRQEVAEKERNVGRDRARAGGAPREDEGEREREEEERNGGEGRGEKCESKLRALAETYK